MMAIELTLRAQGKGVPDEDIYFPRKMQGSTNPCLHGSGTLGEQVR